MILLAVGSLPVLGVLGVVAAMLVFPGVFPYLVDHFAPNIDAPDNWAVAITRMVWLLTVAGIIGIAVLGVGLWLSRRAE